MSCLNTDCPMWLGPDDCELQICSYEDEAEEDDSDYDNFNWVVDPNMESH